MTLNSLPHRPFRTQGELKPVPLNPIASPAGFAKSRAAPRKPYARQPGFRLAAYNAGMTKEALELLQKALTLSEEERAKLAGSLIESLDAEDEKAASEAWDREISRRVADLDSGKAQTIPWEEVQRRISAKLSHDE